MPASAGPRRAARRPCGWRCRRCPAWPARRTRSTSRAPWRARRRSARRRTTGWGGRSRETCTSGSRRPSRSTISSRTGGAAVAVSARTAGGRAASATRAEAQVVRPEVVAPLRDAVRLVDDHQRRARASDLLEHVGVGELLGRHEQELEAVLARRRRAPRSRSDSRDALEETAAAPPSRLVVEALDLVALEGDQRRDDERRPVEQQPGDLVDRRLAVARRHDGQRVAAVRARPRRPRAGPGRSSSKPSASRAVRRIACLLAIRCRCPPVAGRILRIAAVERDLGASGLACPRDRRATAGGRRPVEGQQPPAGADLEEGEARVGRPGDRAVVGAGRRGRSRPARSRRA